MFAERLNCPLPDSSLGSGVGWGIRFGNGGKGVSNLGQALPLPPTTLENDETGMTASSDQAGKLARLLSVIGSSLCALTPTMCSHQGL